MSFFSNVTNLDELKAAYRRLALKYHPDKGGSTAQMQELNSEFDNMYRILSITGAAKTVQTASEFKYEFYTQNGWKGDNYDISLTTKEITKLIRDGIKLMYPLTKWSVSFSSYSGGASIHVALMEAPFNPFLSADDAKSGTFQINHYYIDREPLTDQAKEMFTKVNELIRSYRMDDSDAMIDYFDTNFYYDLEIGKWNNPFKVVEKTPRIGVQANPIDKKVVVKSDGKYDLTVKDDFDTRDHSPLFVVKPTTVLSADDFKRLAAAIKAAGGYYSKFKGGFIFRHDPAEAIKTIKA